MSEIALFGSELETALFGAELEVGLFGESTSGMNKIQINLNAGGATPAGWNNTSNVAPSVGLLIAEGDVTDENDDVVDGVSVTTINAPSGVSSAGIADWNLPTGVTITNSVDAGLIINESDKWPAEITNNYYFNNVGGSVGFRIDGLADNTYTVSALVVTRNGSGTTRRTELDISSTEDSANGDLTYTPLLLEPTTRELIGVIATVDGTITVIASPAVANSTPALTAIILEPAAGGGSPTLTRAYIGIGIGI